MIEIDGTLGEGGGQVLRTALSLSAVLGKPVKIYNIRKKRARPGLRPQHLVGLQLVEKISNGKSEGARIDSMSVQFFPGSLRGISLTANVGTAGAVTLVVQTVLLPLLFAPEPSRIKIIGGTDTDMAPTFDYMNALLLRFVREIGGDVKATLLRRGFYPAGGGAILLEVKPLKRPLSTIRFLQRSKDLTISGVSVVGGLPKDIARRQADSARRTLEKHGLEADIKVEYRSRSEVLSPGTSITLWTEEDYIGASSLGTKGVPAEVVGKRAANYLLRELDSLAPVDRHMGDQMIPFLALADGTSEYFTSQLTLHAYTNLLLIEKIAGASFEIEGAVGKPSIVRIQGIGLEPGSG